MQMEIIKWMDYGKSVMTSTGWMSKDSLPSMLEGTEYITCGILVQETDAAVTLVSSLRGEEVLNPMMIMKSSIIERQKFNTLSNTVMVKETSDTFMNDFISDYMSGMTKKQLSQKYDLAMSEINSYIKEYADKGLIEKRNPKWMHKKSMNSEEFKKDAFVLSTEALMEKYGITKKQSIYDKRHHLKKKMNLKNVAKRVSRKNSSSNVLDSKVVWDLIKTMTQAQIAKKFNVTVYAVRKALGLTNKKVVAV